LHGFLDIFDAGPVVGDDDLEPDAAAVADPALLAAPRPSVA
jgi:hypothetical protein